ncbi:MAG: hypothetical protein ACRYG7_12965 [Janthinobacterium lividum]
MTFTCTITLTDYYDMKADQNMHIYANPLPISGTVSATLQLFVNGKPVGGLFNNVGPVDKSWDLLPIGRLTMHPLN